VSGDEWYTGVFVLQASITKKPSRDGRYDKRSSSSQPPKVIDVKIEKVELHQTENAWKPGKLAESSSDTQVLNKL
jgi:hypothetical protein